MSADDTYLHLKREADKAEKHGLEEEIGTEAGVAYLKCIALRLEMCLRHAESYNGFPGEEGHQPMDLSGLTSRM